MTSASSQADAAPRTVAAAWKQGVFGMRGHRTRDITVTLTSLATAVVAVGCGGGAQPGSNQSPQPPAIAGAQVWLQRYDSGGSDQPGKGMDEAARVAVSRDGSKAFVTGSTATVAYKTSTGARLWAVKSGGASVAAGSDGQAVFVTGTTGADKAADFTTSAYSATTGKQLWQTRYDGPANGADTSAAVVAGGDTVFVTGYSQGTGTGADFATVAYSAATGKQLWVSRYDGPNHRDEMVFPAGPNTLAVSPDGTIVAVTGWSQTTGDHYDYATVGYDARTGSRLWVARYHPASSSDNGAGAVTISQDSRTVFVTGGSGPSMDGSLDVATVAYDARTGAQKWAARYNGPAGRNDGGVAIAATPIAVVVTGISEGKETGHEDYLTLAYDPATGKQQWVTRYDGPGGVDDNAFALALSSDGSKVFVTGRSHTKPGTNTDYGTVAYDITTGHQLWAARYAGYDADNQAVSVATTSGGLVIVTGTSGGPNTSQDYATIAYRG